MSELWFDAADARVYNLICIFRQRGAIIMADRAYNFAAGPAVMPETVLKKAQSELMNWHGCGMSVMEMSHRGSQFAEIHAEAKERVRRLLKVPETHEILFMQGGATAQFAAVPLNFGYERLASYAVTGNFSRIAAEEGAKYLLGTHISWDGAKEEYRRIPRQEELELNNFSAYFHYCANNTIYGTAWDYVPDTNDVPIICDMSSEIMSHPVDVSKYQLIYAGAQKNIAPAGLTLAIVKKRAAGREAKNCPQVMSYQKMIDKDSMLNTPPCWCIYMLGLVLGWIEEQGGLEAMDALRRERSAIVYDVLDGSKLYKAHAERGSRSMMNVTFRTGSAELDAEFCAGAAERGLLNVKGHRLTGGMRASLYNAMPVEGARALAEYMKDFEVKHHV